MTETCKDCRIKIISEATGRFEVEDGVVCKRCFAKRVGEEIEKYPIIGKKLLKKGDTPK